MVHVFQILYNITFQSAAQNCRKKKADELIEMENTKEILTQELLKEQEKHKSKLNVHIYIYRNYFINQDLIIIKILRLKNFLNFMIFFSELAIMLDFVNKQFYKVMALPDKVKVQD